MKKAKQLLAMVFVVISILSMIMIPTSAAEPNTSDTTSTVQVTNNYARNRPYRAKNNTTPIYLLINSNTYTHTYVQAQGCSSDGKIRTNFTVVDGEIVAQVVCRVDVKYSVHTKIYEQGYRYASLDFRHLNYSSTLTTSLNYTWSPDSSGTYTSAT